MILWGAKGLAKEILATLSFDNFNIKDLIFFDNVSHEYDSYIAKNFKLIKTEDELHNYNELDIIIAVGTPKIRKKLSEDILKLGMNECGYISNKSLVSNIDNNIDNTVTILSGCTITASVKIGKSCLINKNVTISHDAIIGNYCEISPNVNILGRVKIGDNCLIGTGAIILPDVIIGDNCIIGASAVVTKDIRDNAMVIGIPAKVVKCLIN
ncbi:hypothetical protein GLP11_15695 [Photobacterium carnosum]|uniref:NeuD/PglB/VioB family sugar acetyltransferase n=1 Tax=Photobacterium carnosum TaxID=2023717 RepID=UPI001F026787|nr:NeuD/PglB/VioB family sugar acetyltransferase [Photobacterium carnosum]MCF2155413.1 hypothetical protein [Photobacterium carnosum]MCF2217233.1 hypothetical protein [Photobacterium carnosum]